MFNQNVKYEYLEEYKETNRNLKKYMTVQFNKVSKMETTLNKDVSCFTVSEIISYYKLLCTPSFEVLMVLNNQFKKYTDYCLGRNLVPDSQNHYTEVNNDVLKTCINEGLANSKVITREALINELNNLNNPSDQFLVLALFEGIYGKQYSELNGISMSNFSEDNVTLNSGRKLKVSKDLIHFAKDSSTEYEYYPYKDTNNRTYKYDENDDGIIKRMYNATEGTDSAYAHNIFNKIIRIKDTLGCNAINAKALMESGRIDMIKNLRKDGNTVEETLRKNKEAIEYRYGKITSIPRWLTKYETFF